LTFFQPLSSMVEACDSLVVTWVESQV
jgi:hypothetical protein